MTHVEKVFENYNKIVLRRQMHNKSVFSRRVRIDKYTIPS